MEAFILKLLEISITSAIMITAVVLLRILWKRIPALSRRVLCILWALVGLRLLLPVTLVSPVGFIPNVKEHSTVIENATSPDRADELVYTENTGDVTQDIPAAVPPEENEKSITNVYTVLFSVWAVGTVSLCTYCIISALKLKKRLLEAVPLNDGDKSVLLCENVSSPFILGLISPVIYMPFGLSKTDERYILAHEHAHIRRGDNIWRVLAILICCIHWFNPFVWLAFYLFCRDTELACDEKVFGRISDSERLTYAEVLLKFSIGKKSASGLCPVAFGESAVKERVRRTIVYKKPLVFVTCIALAISLTVCVFSTSQRPSSSSDEPVPPAVQEDTKADDTTNAPETETEPYYEDTTVPVDTTDTVDTADITEITTEAFITDVPSDTEANEADTAPAETLGEKDTAAETTAPIGTLLEVSNNTLLTVDNGQNSFGKVPQTPQNGNVDNVTDCSASGHDYYETVIISNSCTGYGTKSLICKRCGDTVYQTIQPYGHSYDVERVEATCVSNEKAYKVCIYCNTKSEIAYLPLNKALGHSYNEEHLCIRCGKEEPKVAVKVLKSTLINGIYVQYYDTVYKYPGE